MTEYNTKRTLFQLGFQARCTFKEMLFKLRPIYKLRKSQGSREGRGFQEDKTNTSKGSSLFTVASVLFLLSNG